MYRPYLLLILILFATCSPDSREDIVFFNGTILTMSVEEGQPQPEAVLVRNGIIESLGTRDEVLALAGEETRRIDLHGATMMPGFVAAHTHPDLSAYLHSFVDLSGFTHSSPEGVRNALKQAISRAEPGEWIYCKGFDPILVPGLQKPTLAELDALAPKNPVVILAQSMHSAWANSLAFEALEITAETPPPEPGSYYEVKDGKLTGFIAEVAAMRPFMKAALPTFDIKENFQRVLDDYAKSGISSIGTAGLFGEDEKPLMLMRWLSATDPGVFLRFLGAIAVLPERKPSVRNFVYLKADSPFDLPSSPDRDDPSFQIVGIKLWYDGSPYTGSMYLSQPYEKSELMQQSLGLPAENRGSPVLEREAFRQQVERFHRQGWQLAIHSQGDQANLEVAQVLSEVLSSFPRNDHRHRLEHALLLPQSLIPSLADQGITVSFHINHLYYYGEALRNDIIGERAEEMLPLRSALEGGLRISLHADQPMYPEEPLSLVQTAVERKSRQGSNLAEEEAISVQQALRAVTIDAAWQMGLEDRLGSIEVGKEADFVILGADPTAVPASSIRSIPVLATFVSGRQIAGKPL